MVLEGSDEVVATGYSTAVAYDYARKKSIPIPEDEKERIKAFES